MAAAPGGPGRPPPRIRPSPRPIGSVQVAPPAVHLEYAAQGGGPEAQHRHMQPRRPQRPPRETRACDRPHVNAHFLWLPPGGAEEDCHDCHAGCQLMRESSARERESQDWPRRQVPCFIPTMDDQEAANAATVLTGVARAVTALTVTMETEGDGEMVYRAMFYGLEGLSRQMDGLEGDFTPLPAVPSNVRYQHPLAAVSAMPWVCERHAPTRPCLPLHAGTPRSLCPLPSRRLIRRSSQSSSLQSSSLPPTGSWFGCSR